MKDTGLEKMVLKGRLILKFWTAFEYYIVSFILLVPFSFALYSLFQAYVTDTYDGIRSVGDLMAVTFPFALISIFLFVYQRSRLKFIKVSIRVSETQYEEIIKSIVDKLQLEHVFHDADLFQAVKKSEGTYKMSEMLTVIWRPDCILINSMNTPPKPTFPGDAKYHKRNVALIKSCIDSMIKPSRNQLPL